MKQIFLKLVLGLLCTVFLTSCFKSTSRSNQLQVVATTGMIADLVENIGKEFVDVTALMGPGVDPHLYRATEGDVRRLSSADLIVYNGQDLEAKLADILHQLSDTQVVIAVTDAIDSRELIESEDYEGLYDPHIWFDVRLWSQTINFVRDALIKADEKNKKYYLQNASVYHQKLLQLEKDIRAQLETVPESSRVLVTAHDAFAYFGNAYGFEVKGLQGMNTQAEAGTKDVQDLADFIVIQKIPAIFVESSISDKQLKAVQKAVEAKGGSVVIGGSLFSDAMGVPGTETGTYEGMVRHNSFHIVKALTKD